MIRSIEINRNIGTKWIIHVLDCQDEKQILPFSMNYCEIQKLFSVRNSLSLKRHVFDKYYVVLKKTVDLTQKQIVQIGDIYYILLAPISNNFDNFLIIF